MNNLIKNYKQKKLITCRNKQNELIGIFESIADAADEFLIDEQEIFEAINSKEYMLGSGYWSREDMMIITKTEKSYLEYEDLSLSTERGRHKHPKASIPVVQLDFDTMGLIARYKSMYDAFRITGARNISKCCKGEAQSSGGYKWMFESEYETLINDNNDLM
jgi:hypothetical protein